MIKLSKSLRPSKILKAIFAIFLMFFTSCDFKGPASFKMPTWYFDLMFPLVQQKYSLEGMVDNKQIFSTPDSLGMQLMFEGVFPDTAIGSDVLEIPLNLNLPSVSLPQFPALGKIESISLSALPGLSSGQIIVPLTTSQITDVNGDKFVSAARTKDRKISRTEWNRLVDEFKIPDFEINLPSVTIPAELDFVEKINGFVLVTNSSFISSFENDGLPTKINSSSSKLISEINSQEMTLADHNDTNSLTKSSKSSSITTVLNDSIVGNKLAIRLSADIEKLNNFNASDTDIAGAIANEEVGYSISLNDNGDRLAIGSINGELVRVYSGDGNVWTQLGQTITGPANSYFGNSVSLNGSGDRLAIGAFYDDPNGSESGSVSIYDLVGNTWTLVGSKIEGQAGDNYFGMSVSLNQDGTKLIVGAHGDKTNGIFSGSVNVFQYSGGTWNSYGSKINGEAQNEQLGYSVDINKNGNKIAVGSRYYSELGPKTGAVKVYEFKNNDWSKIGILYGRGQSGEAEFGSAVAMSASGDTVAVSAPGHDNAKGQVRVFKYVNDNNWSVLGSSINGNQQGDLQKEGDLSNNSHLSISSDGDIIAIGGPKNDDSSTNSGNVRIYKLSGGDWSLVGTTLYGDASNDQFGTSVALNSNGSVVAIGALNAGVGQSGIIRSFNSTPQGWSNYGSEVTINKEDPLNVKINIDGDLIFGFAEVEITQKDLDINISDFDFPNNPPIYSGKFKNPGKGEYNIIKIDSIFSKYPMDVNFSMDFRNFSPQVKIDTVVDNEKVITKNFDVNGYDFINPAGSDSIISKLLIDISARIPAQTARIPLNDEKLGPMGFKGGVKGFDFKSLEAEIVQEFPPTEFSITGMPLGFSGMKFVDTKLEIEMFNGIRLPVVLDFDMVGVNQAGDTSKVNALSTLASPTQGGDTSKTIVRLSELGTTTLKYKAPASRQYYDSTTVSVNNNEATIVELMSSNPTTFTVKSRARIDGRGTLEGGMSIGGKYRMLAPFEVVMEPMTFISVTNTPVQEMNYKNRNRIRSTLQSASVFFSIENKIPIAGDLSILMSNLEFFPLDTTLSALRDFKDSLVVKNNWLPSDSVFRVTQCDSLNPETSSIFIFDVMTDFSECVNNVSYLIKSSAGADTVVSYVDTLIKIPLPEPKSLHSVTSSGVHAGQVREAGVTTYSSPLSKERVRLMTDPGQPYMAPRFYLKGSDGKRVYLTTGDYLDINSSVTFTLSSTGMTDPAPNEIVVRYPNGGENILKDNETTLKWKTYGSISKIDLSYYAGGNPDINKDEDWIEIAKEITNVDSFLWTPSATSGINSLSATQKDSVRIRVKSTDGKTRDMSGWYFSISDKSQSQIPETGNAKITLKTISRE